jgi:hypothetical protein
MAIRLPSWLLPVLLEAIVVAAEATVVSCPGGRADTVGTVEPAAGGAGLPVVGCAVVVRATPVGIAVGAVETRVGCGVLVAVGAAIVGATAGCPVGAVMRVRVGGVLAVLVVMVGLWVVT